MTITPNPISTLVDIQSSSDERGIALQQVGVSRIEVPLKILGKNGHVQQVTALVNMSVDLPAAEKGTHMSRFINQLTQHYQQRVFGWDWQEFLNETCQLLESNNAFIDAEFKYFIDKKAPVTAIVPLWPMTFTFPLEKHHKSMTLAWD